MVEGKFRQNFQYWACNTKFILFSYKPNITSPNYHCSLWQCPILHLLRKQHTVITITSTYAKNSSNG